MFQYKVCTNVPELHNFTLLLKKLNYNIIILHIFFFLVCLFSHYIPGTPKETIQSYSSDPWKEKKVCFRSSIVTRACEIPTRDPSYQNVCAAPSSPFVNRLFSPLILFPPFLFPCIDWTSAADQ